jgi:RES domain-containing protein
MILGSLGSLGSVTAYRMHTPRWASAPTSGAGARAHGGRANRPGTDALYLALESDTALREYQQLSLLMPPGTLVSYTVEAEPILDFRSGYQRAHWPELWEEFFCDWRELWFNQHIEPPSWVLSDQALACGAKGIAFSSTVAVGGTNLVLFNDKLTASDKLQVYDPNEALPKNHDSWR